MAKKLIEGDYSPADIRAMLENHAESSEDTKYYVDLTEQDLIERHQELSKNLIELNRLTEELKDIKDDFKDRMKPYMTRQKELLEAIGVKKELVEGKLFHVANQDDGVMETFTEYGEFYSSRRLKPEERQMRAAFPMNKAVGE